MALILTEEKTVPKVDPVTEAARALVEEAMLSESTFSSAQLQEMVAAQVTALAEAGGLISWLKRAYTGMDSDLVEELRGELKTRITSEEKRAEVLKEIDGFLHAAKNLTGGQIAYHLLAPHGWIGPVVSFALRSANKKSGDRAKYIAALEKVRAEAAKLKIEKKD